MWASLWAAVKTKFKAGWQTYLLGAWGVVSPPLLNYALNFDYSKLGLSSGALQAVGMIIMGVRLWDSVGEGVKPVTGGPGLTGSEIAGPNAANKR